MKQRYLTAQEAAAALHVTVPTLYAYVSRGLIRSEEAGGSTRSRRYHAEDVARLQERKEQRRNPSEVAERALYLGAPVLESAITLIAGGRFFYRGHDALTLAVTRSVEQIAALIWTGNEDHSASLFPAQVQPLSPRLRSLQAQLQPCEPVGAFSALLAVAAGDDLAAHDRRPLAVAQTGARIVRLLTAAAIAPHEATGGMAESLQHGWVAADMRAAALLNTALILCADHELNVTSFAARCVASAGATPYGVVLAGLAALQGTEHGGQTRRIAAFFHDAEQRGVRRAIGDWLARGEPVPGFGHPLYPDGDPRGRLLLRLIAEVYPGTAAAALAAAVSEEGYQLLGEHPGIDIGLVALARAMGLAMSDALTIFALGRSIGWIGHAIEQYQTERVIRPRARYTGRAPDP